MKDRQVKRADGYDKSEKSDKNPVGQDVVLKPYSEWEGVKTPPIQHIF